MKQLIFVFLKFFSNPRVYNIIMKIGGVCCIFSGIIVLIRHYAEPISAAIAYFFIGYLFTIMKYSIKKDK